MKYLGEINIRNIVDAATRINSEMQSLLYEIGKVPSDENFIESKLKIVNTSLDVIRKNVCSSFDSRRLNLINKIAKRGARLHKKLTGTKLDVVSLSLDISSCDQHCPIDLDRLLKADSGTFGHDVFGIRKFLNRKTGQLVGGFCPRTVRHEGAL